MTKFHNLAVIVHIPSPNIAVHMVNTFIGHIRFIDLLFTYRDEYCLGYLAMNLKLQNYLHSQSMRFSLFQQYQNIAAKLDSLA